MTISFVDQRFILLLANVVDGVDSDRNWISNWCHDSYEAVEGELCLVRTRHGAKVVLARIRSLYGPDHHMSYADLSQGMIEMKFKLSLVLLSVLDRHYMNGEKKYSDGLKYLLEAGEGLYSRYSYMLFYARNSFCPYRKAG